MFQPFATAAVLRLAEVQIFRLQADGVRKTFDGVVPLSSLHGFRTAMEPVIAPGRADLFVHL
jgi:hypothetical protein